VRHWLNPATRAFVAAALVHTFLARMRLAAGVRPHGARDAPQRKNPSWLASNGVVEHHKPRIAPAGLSAAACSALF